jgi:hypothetical protein
VLDVQQFRCRGPDATLPKAVLTSMGMHKGCCWLSQHKRGQIKSSRVESGRSLMTIEPFGSMDLDSNTCFQFPFDSSSFLVQDVKVVLPRRGGFGRRSRGERRMSLFGAVFFKFFLRRGRHAARTTPIERATIAAGGRGSSDSSNDERAKGRTRAKAGRGKKKRGKKRKGRRG